MEHTNDETLELHPDKGDYISDFEEKYLGDVAPATPTSTKPCAQEPEANPLYVSNEQLATVAQMVLARMEQQSPQAARSCDGEAARSCDGCGERRIIHRNDEVMEGVEEEEPIFLMPQHNDRILVYLCGEIRNLVAASRWFVHQYIRLLPQEEEVNFFQFLGNENFLSTLVGSVINSQAYNAVWSKFGCDMLDSPDVWRALAERDATCFAVISTGLERKYQLLPTARTLRRLWHPYAQFNRRRGAWMSAMLTRENLERLVQASNVAGDMSANRVREYYKLEEKQLDTRISTRRDHSYNENLFQRPPKAPVRTRVGQVSKRGKKTRR